MICTIPMLEQLVPIILLWVLGISLHVITSPL
jgi:hypothetical protein